MGWREFPFLHFSTRDINACLRSRTEHSVGRPYIERTMELVRHAAPYKLQETSGYMKGCSGSSPTGLLTENLFGQHDVDCLYQQVLGTAP
jgi:hypothetical protein